MTFLELIEKKKRGDELSGDEIDAAIRAYCGGEAPDYQMAALLMAVRWRGLSDEETSALTTAMIASGETFDLGDIPGPKVDKHSTGGVGDKVSLVLAPLAAVCGCVVPMVSGRGLGHTGGTLDKLESIPGFRTDLDAAAFRRLLAEHGVAMGAQTDALVPADRGLYALRSATGTIDDSGLITASILSKKIAEGAEALVLDVKVGAGAFLPDLDAARRLARRLCAVAQLAGMRCRALLTDMEQPLGRAVGNAPEVAEAIRCLRGDAGDEGADLRRISLELVAEMLLLGGLSDDLDAARARATSALDDGSALQRFGRLVESQGGDPEVVERLDLLPRAADEHRLLPPRAGFVGGLDARRIGEAAVALGAGRDKKEDEVDAGAGLVLHAKRGDPVEPDEPWVTLYGGAGADFERATARLQAALEITEEPPEPRPLIVERIG